MTSKYFSWALNHRHLGRWVILGLCALLSVLTMVHFVRERSLHPETFSEHIEKVTKHVDQWSNYVEGTGTTPEEEALHNIKIYLNYTYDKEPLDWWRVDCKNRVPVGNWMYCPNVPWEHYKSMSFGIGTDTSFDRAMAFEHKQVVYMFDPTPMSLAFISLARQKPTWNHEKMLFYDFGLSLTDEPIELFIPEKEGDVQYSSEFNSVRYLNKGSAESFPAYTLKTFMRFLKVKCLDMLKVDIEGHEHLLLEQFILHHLLDCVNHLCFEFHNYDMKDEFQGRIHSKMIHQVVGMLKEVGFAPFWSDPHYTLFRGSSLVNFCFYRTEFKEKHGWIQRNLGSPKVPLEWLEEYKNKLKDSEIASEDVPHQRLDSR